MWVEVGFLIVFILVITLFYRRQGYDITERFLERTEEWTEEEKETNQEDYLRKLEKIDLRKERSKLLDELERADKGAHAYPSNATRAAVRVGLERAIAEIDRALEQEGRFLDIKSIESIVNSIQRNLQMKN